MSYPSTIALARRLELAAARGLADEARDRRDEAHREIARIGRSLLALERHLSERDREWFVDALAGLLDAASNIDGEVARACDAAGEYPPEPIDLADERERLETLRRKP